MSPGYVDEIDVSLIRWMLSLTPAERLETLENFLDDLAEITDRNARRQISLDSSYTR
jgi:hypothetical protein